MSDMSMIRCDKETKEKFIQAKALSDCDTNPEFFEKIVSEHLDRTDYGDLIDG